MYVCTIGLNSLFPTWPPCAIIFHIIFYIICTIEGSNVGRYREIIPGRIVRIWGPGGQSSKISRVRNTRARQWGCRKLHALFCDHRRWLGRWGVGQLRGRESWGNFMGGSLHFGRPPCSLEQCEQSSTSRHQCFCLDWHLVGVANPVVNF